ncbi:MAG: ATP-binding protein [Desulfobacterales bacterium]
MQDSGKRSATRITVILPSGEVIGDSQETPSNMENHASRVEIRQAMAAGFGFSVRYSDTLQKKMMYVAIPVIKDEKILAVLRTSIPITSIDEALVSVQIKIAIGGLVIALLAAGVSLYVTRRISRPIEKIKQGADHFSRGNLTHRLPTPDTEEMASLSEAMNKMAAQLDERIKIIDSQRNELKAVFASMTEGVIVVDKTERIISINEEAAKIFESDLPTLKGRTIQEAIRDPVFQRFIAQALLSLRPLEDDIILYRGGERILNVRCSPLLDAKRSHIGALVLINDVTQFRRLENMRRDFVANVSHEIKTPLTAIKGYVEPPHTGSVDKPEERERFLNIIIKHVDRLESILEDLLSLSRLEQEDEKKKAKFKTRRIKFIINTAIQVCQSKADEKNIAISLSCEDEISARVDATLLEQAFVNLIDNAVKYSDPGSEIHIAAGYKNSHVYIDIRDHGPGIPKKHLTRLFERFYRVDKARSRKLGGTGLGLAIVKHIARAHGGEVTVESTLGEGSTFTIQLPR